MVQSSSVHIQVLHIKQQCYSKVYSHTLLYSDLQLTPMTVEQCLTEARGVLQNAPQRPADVAERRAQRAGWGAAQQVPVPQHHGAQRAGQEDRHHAGHCEYELELSTLFWGSI